MISRLRHVAQIQRGFAFSTGPAKKYGFTLIELLVVIAIISLLVSILLPSLTRAKALARQVVCATNLKAWGPAILMYANDNSGTMIARAGPPVTDGWDRWMSHWWAERRNQLVDNYGLAKGLWYSPDEQGDIELMWGEGRGGSYRVFGGYFYLPRHREICQSYGGDNDIWPIGIRRDISLAYEGEMISDGSAVPLMTDYSYFADSNGGWITMHQDPSTGDPEVIHSLWLDGHVASPRYPEIENKNYAYRFGGIFTW